MAQQTSVLLDKDRLPFSPPPSISSVLGFERRIIRRRSRINRSGLHQGKLLIQRAALELCPAAASCCTRTRLLCIRTAAGNAALTLIETSSLTRVAILIPACSYPRRPASIALSISCLTTVRHRALHAPPMGGVVRFATVIAAQRPQLLLPLPPGSHLTNG